MKQTKLLLLFLLLSLIPASKLRAQAVGSSFTVDDITYTIMSNDLINHVNNIAFIRKVAGSGVKTVPATVVHPQNRETYKVTETYPWMDSSPNTVTGIKLSEGLTKINEGSFYFCRGVQSIHIPASCTSISKRCFYGNTALTSFTVASGNTAYQSNSNGWILNKAGTTLVYIPSGIATDITIPNTITTIEQSAIFICQNLKKVYIPASVSTIAYGASSDQVSIAGSATFFDVDDTNPYFQDINGVLCNKSGNTIIAFPRSYSSTTSDGKYTVPASVKTIARYAFYEASPYPKTLDMNNVQTIEAEACVGMYALESVTIGANVATVGFGAFTNCSRLTAFTVNSANTKYIANDGVLFTKDATHLVLFPCGKTGNYTVPEGTVEIDSRAFQQTRSTGTITIASSVKTIESAAFRFSSFTKLSFAPTSQLKTIKLQAFNGSAITGSITLPATISTIENQAFSETQLKEVRVASGSLLAKINNTSFAKNNLLENFIFEGSANNLTTIEEFAFQEDPLLKTFTVPASVTTINRGAFQKTPALETVTFNEPASISTIGNGAFGYSGIKNISLPSSIRIVEQQAFDNCTNLQTIKIPAGVTSIQTGAFNFCEKLTAINVDPNNLIYSSLDGMLCSKDKKTLVTFPAGKADTKYTLIPYFETVGQYAFYASNEVTNITFPRSITTINTRALALCKNLKSLSFMGTDNVPSLSTDILYESSNPTDITVYVRKAWFENPTNATTIQSYNTTFKEVHPSFVPTTGYDRGTEFFPTSTTHVGAIGFYNPRTSVIINPTVTEEAYTDIFNKNHPQTTYTVSSILDFAYETSNTVKAITVLADVGYVGLNAFKGASIEDIYFTGDTPASLGSVSYELPGSYPFKSGQKIYVKESKVSDYKTKWEVNGNTLSITHEIPAKTLANRATACYPFNVVYKTDGDVIPYLPLQYKMTDQLSQDKAYVRARSIDDGRVPAYIGVMLVSENNAAATSYCQMNESQQQMSITGITEYDPNTYYMKGCVEDTEVKSDNDYTLFGLTKTGIFKTIGTTGNTVPYFKSYLSIPKASIPMGAKSIVFVFDDDETTGISDINVEEDINDAPYYDLKGMKVENPQRGIYIRNGKKVIIK